MEEKSRLKAHKTLKGKKPGRRSRAKILELRSETKRVRKKTKSKSVQTKNQG